MLEDSGNPGWAGRGAPQSAESRSDRNGGALDTLSARCFFLQAPPGPAMEFPDLGAHCSEPSCQRLGKGQGRTRRGLGTAGGAWTVGSRGDEWSIWKYQKKGGARGRRGVVKEIDWGVVRDVELATGWLFLSPEREGR